MVRYQEFNTQEVLGKAMQVFWSKGYKGASMRDLLDEMGIGKGSFYATFGSKRELFLSALKHFGKKQAMMRQEANALAGLPAKKAIAHILKRVIDRTVDDKQCCMFGKTALEFWQRDAEIADEVAEGVKQVEEAFRQVIERGQKASEIPAKHDPEALAQFLTSTFYGLQVMASAIPDRKALEHVVTNTLAVLD